MPWIITKVEEQQRNKREAAAPEVTMAEVLVAHAAQQKGGKPVPPQPHVPRPLVMQGPAWLGDLRKGRQGGPATAPT